MTYTPPFRMTLITMRFTQISIAVPCALALLAGTSSPLLGQQSGPSSNRQQPANRPPTRPAQANSQVVQTAAAPKPARPEPDNLIIPELSPELEAILKDWEVRSAAIKTLHGKHQRTVYNLVFEVEKR